jgi:hypothetical protein
LNSQQSDHLYQKLKKFAADSNHADLISVTIAPTAYQDAESSRVTYQLSRVLEDVHWKVLRQNQIPITLEGKRPVSAVIDQRTSEPGPPMAPWTSRKRLRKFYRPSEHCFELATLRLTAEKFETLKASSGAACEDFGSIFSLSVGLRLGN